VKLFYYQDAKGNFGDDLNDWLWHRLLPAGWDTDTRIILTGIGTIIGRDMPHAEKSIIFGSGTGYTAAPAQFGSGGWTVMAVRGPLTAQALDLPETKAVTDGAILLSLLPEFQPVPAHQRHGIVFMPHHKSARLGCWPEICQAAGIDYLDPAADSYELVQRLQSAQLVLADAMHAAIVADSLRVPWLPVIISPESNSFKWLDWTLSMALPYRPIVLPCSNLLESLHNWLLCLLRAGYAVPDITVDKALDYYAGLLSRRKTIWRLIARRGIALFMPPLQVILRSWPMRQIFRHRQQKQFDYAVAALKAACMQPGFLSDPLVFDARKAEMERRLTFLRQLCADQAVAQSMPKRA